MAFIRTIDETHATDELAALYRRHANPDGTVDEILKLHSVNPGAIAAHGAVYAAAMHAPSPLSRVEREIVAIVVSRENECFY